MKLQDRKLKAGTQGADVSLLHFALRLLDFTIPEEELYRNAFDEGTEQAVRRFQERSIMEVDGIVGRVTAGRINAEVSEVSTEDVLELLAEELRGHHAWMDALVAENSDLQRETKLLQESVEALQARHDQLKDEANVSPTRVTELEEELAVVRQCIAELENQRGSQSEKPFIVSGHVVNTAHGSLSGVRVVAVDKNFSEEMMLGDPI